MYTRSVIITGGTVGLGYEAALAIARQKPEYQIVLAARGDRDHAAEALGRQVGRSDAAVFRRLDLADLESVRSFAASFAGQPPIQALLLNAAVMYPGATVQKTTTTGLETTFAVAHVGHTLLFHLLVPYFADQGNVRIVVTSSSVHDPAQKAGLPDAEYTTAQELAFPADDDGKTGRQRYTSCKLANVLWTYALDRRIQSLSRTSQLSIVAFDPGFMPGTGLYRDAGSVVRFAFQRVLPKMLPVLRLFVFGNTHTVADSGAALARLAMDVQGQSGKYYSSGTQGPVKSSKDSYVEAKQEDLWRWTTEYLAGGDEEQLARFQELR